MICIHCGNVNVYNARYCIHCGFKLKHKENDRTKTITGLVMAVILLISVYFIYSIVNKNSVDDTYSGSEMDNDWYEYEEEYAMDDNIEALDYLYEDTIYEYKIGADNFINNVDLNALEKMAYNVAYNQCEMGNNIRIMPYGRIKEEPYGHEVETIVYIENIDYMMSLDSLQLIGGYYVEINYPEIDIDFNTVRYLFRTTKTNVDDNSYKGYTYILVYSDNITFDTNGTPQLEFECLVDETDDDMDKEVEWHGPQCEMTLMPAGLMETAYVDGYNMYCSSPIYQYEDYLESCKRKVQYVNIASRHIFDMEVLGNWIFNNFKKVFYYQ